MIGRWEIVPDPAERFPGRHRVNVSAAEEELRPLLDRFSKKAGRPWAPRGGGTFRLSFYFYDLTDEDRRALEGFFARGVLPPSAPEAPRPSAPKRPDVKKPPLPPAAETSPWDAPAPEVEILSADSHGGARPSSAGSPPREEGDVQLETPADALMGWTGAPPAGGWSPSLPPTSSAPSTPPSEPSFAPEASPDAGEPRTEAPIVVSSSDIGMPVEELIPSKEPEPTVPAGHIFLRVGYFVPQDLRPVADHIHQTLVQTLESRKMPFTFYKAFVFPYRWPDKPLVDLVVDGVKKHRVDCLICVGEERRLELLLERCAENKIRHYLLTREASQKKYWRLGMITRLVVAEE